MKTKILFDLEASQTKKNGMPHGGGEYAKAVFTRLAAENNSTIISAFYNPSKWLDPELRALALKARINLAQVCNKNELQQLINITDFNKFYSALPYKYFDLDLTGLQVIFTIHGLRGIDINEGRVPSKSGPFERFIRTSIKSLIKPNLPNTEREKFKRLLSIKAEKLSIIVPSLHTKYTLINNFPEICMPNIRVLYSPIQSSLPEEYLTDYDLTLNDIGLQNRKYFLLVNTNRPEKNAQFGMQALDNVFCRFPSLKRQVLVLGADKNHPNIQKYYNKSFFKIMGYVEKNILELIYKNAYALIYPSLSEGFGYPPLECMRFGTPVLCSINTSMAEIYGGAALFFNPLLLEELEIRILTILSEKEVWDDYSKKGFRRYQEINTKQNRDLESLINHICLPI